MTTELYYENHPIQVKSITRELEDICKMIAGKWYSEDESHSIDFSATNRLFKEAAIKLSIKGQPSHKTTYIIGIIEDMPLLNETKFYFEVGKRRYKKRYLIKAITKNKMVVSQLDGYAKKWDDVTYIRKK